MLFNAGLLTRYILKSGNFENVNQWFIPSDFIKHWPRGRRQKRPKQSTKILTMTSARMRWNSINNFCLTQILIDFIKKFVKNKNKRVIYCFNWCTFNNYLVRRLEHSFPATHAITFDLSGDWHTCINHHNSFILSKLMTQNHYQAYFCEENDIPNISTMINEQ